MSAGGARPGAGLPTALVAAITEGVVRRGTRRDMALGVEKAAVNARIRTYGGTLG